MKISKNPRPYHGVFSPAIYQLDDSAPDSETIVEILDENSTLIGIKRMVGLTSYKVNVSDYFKRRFAITPAAETGTLLFSDAAKTTGCILKAGGVSAPLVYFTAGVGEIMERKQLSNAPYKTDIIMGDSDEIYFAAPGANCRAVITYPDGNIYPAGTAVCGNQIQVLRVDTAQLTDFLEKKEISWLSADIYLDEKLAFRKIYNIKRRKKSHRRLSWLNPYGCLDYYTFEDDDTETLEIDKHKLYMAGGYETVLSTARTVIGLTSGYSNTETLKWLSEIVTSPSVWILSGRQYLPVDVITDKVVVRDTGPCALNLKIRNKSDREFQHK